MIAHRAILIGATCATLIVLRVLAAMPAAADDRIISRFEMFGLAGVHVLTLRNQASESGDRYAITLDFRTEGIARLFVDQSTHAQVSGRLLRGTPQPDRFGNDTHRNGVDRKTIIAFRGDGTVDAAMTPPLQEQIPAGTIRDAIDSLTAYFRLERQVNATGRCAMSAHVFDGRHGYDLTFTDMGRHSLTPRGGQGFAGQATACRMTRTDWPNFPDPERDEGARGGVIWYARLLPGDLMVPVRTEMDTQLGVVDGFLAELHGRGADITLMH
jgi:uncharacterized protein DUF3108